MKIKTKLTLGVGLLFLLIILLTVVSTWYINALKRDTNNILTANYNTLQYSRNMILALDEMNHDPHAVARFEANLKKQKGNETEPEEKKMTDQVAAHFVQLKKDIDDSALKSVIRTDISALMLLNMQAIEHKSEVASRTAATATLWVDIVGTLCFLIAFILLVNLPGSIANPIEELTKSIKGIAAHNYNHRVHLKGHSEFGELARSFNAMAEKLEEYAGSNVARLLMEKRRIETLINNMRDPVMGLDETGKVIFANNEALKITGLKETDFIGKEVHQIAENNDLMHILIKDLDSGNSDARANAPLKIFSDKKESYFEKEIVAINIIPTGEKEAKVIGHVIMLRNVTPFKELDFAKTNFIATISHELKTPISSIKMSVQLLENNKTGLLNEGQSQLLESIKDDSNRLLRITGELLNMSQVETGNIQLNIQQSSPYSILQYATNATKMQAEQKRIMVSVDIDDDLPDINIDSEKTAWVLTNFITNAIRYSDEDGKIILSLKETNQEICYSVQDFGKGIEPKYREKVFERYFQIPGSLKTGTGLGLAISKDFIEAQGGHIGVETEAGLGSRFFFCFHRPNNDRRAALK
jgi:PAS domain S-box-containing protein